MVTEGNLLGFIVSKEGMIIDPKCTEAISNIVLPGSWKPMQSFLGKINFVCRFIPNFVQVVKKEQINAFVEIRKAIAEALALMSPDFNKDFILYTFSTEFSNVAILTQKHHDDAEIPISFMISTFKGDELNYSHIDKHAYAVYKSVKIYRPYLLKSWTKVIVPYVAT